jgi:hypothetical protein
VTSERRFWWWHGLALFLLASQFIAFRLAAILESQGRFGLKLGNMSDRAWALAGLGSYLFPGTWVLLGGLAALGCIIMLTRRNFHWIGPAFVLSLAITAVYVFVLKKLPYPRVFGFWLVLALLSVGWLWRWAAQRAHITALASKIVISIALLIPIAASVKGALKPSFPIDYSRVGQVVSQDIDRNHGEPGNTLVLLPSVVSDEMKLYLPKDHAFFSPIEKAAEITVYIPCQQDSGITVFRTQTTDRIHQEFAFWPLPQIWSGTGIFHQAGYSVFKTRCRIQEVPRLDDLMEGSETILFWVPSERHFQTAAYIDTRLKSDPSTSQLQLLINANVSPLSVAIFTSPETSAARKALLQDLLTRAGGKIYSLKPL